MNSPSIDKVMRQLKINVPKEYVQLFTTPSAIPGYFRNEVYTEPEQVMQLNTRLRQEGFFSEKWPHHFVALGEDPGGNVYFLDSRDPKGPIYLADHERLYEGGPLVEFGGTERLAATFTEWLKALGQQDQEMEQEQPFSVYSRGHEEFDRLRTQPNSENLRALFLSRALPLRDLPPARRSKALDHLFDYMFTNLPSHVCFELIAPAVDNLLQQTDPCMFEAALYLLADIAEGSRTTEQPIQLSESWETIQDRLRLYRLSHAGDWQRLQRQYRLNRR